MRTAFRLPRVRMLRTRLTASLAALGVVTMTAGSVMLSAPAASAHDRENDGPNATASATAICSSDGSGWDATFTVTNGWSKDGVFSGAPSDLNGAYSPGGDKTVTVHQGFDDASAALSGTMTWTWTEKILWWTETHSKSKTVQASVNRPEGCSRHVVVPAVPTISQPHCVEGKPGQATDGEVTLPASDEWVTYSRQGDKVIAQIDGAKSQWGTLPPGWTSTATTATFVVQFQDPGDCRGAVVPAMPTVTQPQCVQGEPGQAGEGGFTLPADGNGITYTRDGNTVIATLNTDEYKWGELPEGWRVDEGQPGVATYTVQYQSPGDCLVTVTPVAPEVGEWVCTGPGAAEAPSVSLAETKGLTYRYDEESKRVVATLEEGYQFPEEVSGWAIDGASAYFEVDFGTAPPCLVEKSVETAPSVTAATCAAPGHLVLPASEFYSWTGDTKDTVGNHTVTAVAAQGYVLTGTKSWTLHVPSAGEGLDCRGTVTPTVPSIEQAVCTGPGTSSQPAVDLPSTPGLTYSYDEASSTVTATADSAHKLAGQLPEGWVAGSDTSASYKVDLTSPGDCLEQVTPAAPTFTEPDCKHPNGAAAVYTDTDAVDYTRTGALRQGGTVTVTAAPKPGYTFPAGFEATWTHTFVDGIVCGTEAVKPPAHHATGSKAPGAQVLGTEAVVPTAVDAGLAGVPAAATGTRNVWPFALTGAGLLMLASAGFLGQIGRRRSAKQH